ncbi:MAG: GldM family protein [Bacteroidota bacterium]
MALPKEPRQKMINMMYLVLTALLALNVSSEILNAFKVVDNSLISSNGVINTSNSTIASSLEAQGKKPELADKVAIWKPKADAAIKMANGLSASIETLKKQLKVEAGLEMVDGVEQFKEDDLEAATRLFGVKGEGSKLQASLAAYAKNVAEIIPADKRATLPKLPIDVSMPKTQNANLKNWTDAYFHMTPTVAALTILSKFQNDVLRSGNIVAEHCQNQIGKVEVILDKFEILTSQNTNYLLPGQTLEIKAGIGAFSSNAKPTVSINGVSQVANDSGFARYTTQVSGGSGGNVPISVSFKDPNTGQVMTKSTSVAYTVGVPSGASIFLEKMNVMYAGVDNPVTVSAGSIKAEKMSVSFSKGSISRAGGDRWIAKVSGLGEGTITVSGDGKSFSFPIRCKKLPPPTPMVGTLKSGNVSTAAFKAMGGVRAILEESEFSGAPFVITSYTIGGFINGEPRESQVSGPSFGGQAIISSAKPGSIVGIYNIHAKGPDGSDYKLGDLFYNLK